MIKWYVKLFERFLPIEDTTEAVLSVLLSLLMLLLVALLISAVVAGFMEHPLITVGVLIGLGLVSLFIYRVARYVKAGHQLEEMGEM